MSKKLKIWALVMYGELMLNELSDTKKEALERRKELLEDPYHCSTCDCEPIEKEKIKVVELNISY